MSNVFTYTTEIKQNNDNQQRNLLREFVRSYENYKNCIGVIGSGNNKDIERIGNLIKEITK